MLPEKKRSPNPLFIVLAVLSAIPTAFFLLLTFSGADVVGGLGFLWSAMWTYVWWKMADRYR